MKYIVFMLLLVCAALWAVTGAADEGGPSEHDKPGMMMHGDKGMADMPGEHGKSVMNLEHMRAMNAMYGPMMDGVIDPDPDPTRLLFAACCPITKARWKMAEIQPRYGTDPELRKLARKIINDQQQEITFMEDWG